MNPLNPSPTWQKPRGKRSRRLVDTLADAIDSQDRAERKMRRAFRAWEKAGALVDRLNKRLTREAGES